MNIQDTDIKPEDEQSEESALSSSNEKSEEQKEGADSEQSQESSDKSGSSPMANLAGSINIDPGKRLPELDNGPIKAYEAFSDKNENLDDLFALVCDPHLAPRYKKINAYESIINPHAAKLVKHGVVYWPPAKSEVYVFVYRNNLGRPILPKGDKQALHMNVAFVLENILHPLVNLLHDFKDRNFSHNAIRPSNIYSSDSDKVEKIVLGDGLAAPSSYCQPALFETIPRGMAEPIGRGPGTNADDIYSLGVTIACLVRSRDPVYGMSDEDIVRMKMELGSYATIIGNERFSGTILDFMRGTLNDDPENRWNLEDIRDWMDGQRIRPRNNAVKLKAARGLDFNGKKYIYPSFLALELHENPSEAKRILEEGDLENWLKRSLSKNNIFEAMTEAVQKTKEAGQGKGFEDRLVSIMSMALDPSAPIRYKGRCFLGEGIGTALAEAFYLDKNLSCFHEIIATGIALSWSRMQDNPDVDTNSLISKFDSCRSCLKNSRAGFGLERCLYILSPETRCLSENFKEYYVMNPEHMIAALEDLCGKNKTPPMLLDRHCIAFLLVREGRLVEKSLVDLSAGEYHRNVLGQLQVLATIQRLNKTGPVPHIARAFSNMFPEVYNRIHDTSLREKLQFKIEPHIKSGNLIKIYEIMNNPNTYRQDFLNFKKAVRDYRSLDEELQNLEYSLRDKEKFGRSTGKEIAGLVSCVLAGIIILAVAFLYVGQRFIF